MDESTVRRSLQNSAAWKLVGIQIRELSAESSVLELPLGPQHFHSGGVVHGGLIAMLIDCAAVAALFPTLRSNETVLTIEFKVNFFSPGRGSHLQARGHHLKRGRRVSVVAVDVLDEREETIAHGVVTQLIESQNGQSAR